MDIYTRKSLWKWYLAAAGVLIVILSLWYTKNLADQLAEREKQQVEQYLAAQRLLGKAETDPNQFFNCDVSFPLQVVQANTTVPILLIGDNGKIDGFVNIGEDSMGFLDPVDVEKIRVRMVEEGADTMHINPTEDVHQIVMYSKSRLLMLLEWYPYIQLLLISAFIFSDIWVLALPGVQNKIRFGWEWPKKQPINWVHYYRYFRLDRNPKGS
ncbi:MAG: hypothetical protein R2778_05465 [Saprospiraceae bacterium]